MPDWRWTWDDLRTVAREIKKKGAGRLCCRGGQGDLGRCWSSSCQRGKALYTEEGQLAFTQEDITDYFGLWDSLRQEGLRCLRPT